MPSTQHFLHFKSITIKTRFTKPLQTTHQLIQHINISSLNYAKTKTNSIDSWFHMRSQWWNGNINIIPWTIRLSSRCYCCSTILHTVVCWARAVSILHNALCWALYCSHSLHECGNAARVRPTAAYSNSYYSNVDDVPSSAFRKRMLFCNENR